MSVSGSGRVNDVLLSVERVSAGYGDFQALFDLSAEVAAGSTVAIIGANGAGKSTLLRAVMGQVKVFDGSVHFDGRDLSGVATHDRVAAGIALVPEGRRLFPSLTVEENLRIGAYSKRPGQWSVATVLEVFPMLEPPARAPGLDVVRWRAAGRGDRARV